MNNKRVQAFNDGVLVIILTIMVLELKVPHSADWGALKQLAPTLICYFLSFSFIALYWANHHHLLNAVRSVNMAILIANLHLLFWLSLIPFATSWMGQSNFASNPVACYAILLLICRLSNYVLKEVILISHKGDKVIKAEMRANKKKSVFSAFAYTVAIPVAYYNPMISFSIFILIGFVWLIPEKYLKNA